MPPARRSEQPYAPPTHEVAGWTPEVIGNFSPELLEILYDPQTKAISLDCIRAMNPEQREALNWNFLTEEQRELVERLRPRMPAVPATMPVIDLVRLER